MWSPASPLPGTTRTSSGVWRSFFFRVEAPTEGIDHAAEPDILEHRFVPRAELPPLLTAPYHRGFLAWLASGGELRYVSTHHRPVHDDEGSLMGSVLVFHDITQALINNGYSKDLEREADLVEERLWRQRAGMSPGEGIHTDEAVHAGVHCLQRPLPLRDVVVDHSVEGMHAIHDPSRLPQGGDEEAHAPTAHVGERLLHLGILGLVLEPVHELADAPVALSNAVARGQLHIHHDLWTVRLRHELLGHLPEEPEADDQHAHAGQHHARHVALLPAGEEARRGPGGDGGREQHAARAEPRDGEHVEWVQREQRRGQCRRRERAGQHVDATLGVDRQIERVHQSAAHHLVPDEVRLRLGK